MEKNQRTVSFEAGESGEKKNRKWLFVAVAVLVGAPIIGSTLAASIDINGGGGPEFAQGNTQTTSCDTTMTASPGATWDSTAGNFKLGSVTVSGVNLSACDSKTMRIQVVDNTNFPVDWCGVGCNVATITLNDPNLPGGISPAIVTGAGTLTLSLDTTDVTNAMLTMTVDTPTLSAGSADEILIETL